MTLIKPRRIEFPLFRVTKQPAIPLSLTTSSSYSGKAATLLRERR